MYVVLEVAEEVIEEEEVVVVVIVVAVIVIAEAVIVRAPVLAILLFQLTRTNTQLDSY